MDRGISMSVVATGRAASSARPATVVVIARALALAGVAALAFAVEDIERAVAATAEAGTETTFEADADCLSRYRWQPRLAQEKCATPATETNDEPVGAAGPVPDGGVTGAADQTGDGSTVFTIVTLEDGTTVVILECPECTYRWQPAKQRECLEKNSSIITIESLTGEKVTLDQCGESTTVFPDGSASEPGPPPDFAVSSKEQLDEIVGEPGSDPDPEPDPGDRKDDDDDDDPPDPPDPPERPDIGINFD